MSTTHDSTAAVRQRRAADPEHVRHLPAGAALAEVELQRLWLLQEGVVAVCHPAQDGGCDHPEYLALPGNLIGAERLAGEATPSRINVLAAAVLVAVPSGTAAQRQGLLAPALAQARRQAREFLSLRSGSLADRVRHLLLLLGAKHGEEVDLKLPQLRQLSSLLDATPEAICRVLGGLRRMDVLVAQQHRHTRVVRRALNDLVVPPGISSGLGVRRPTVRVT
jgi:hypothetical protein